MELTVVLPCFNEVENIEHTIQDVHSWFQKAGIDGEIIVVDDGSTDGTGELAEKLSKKMPALVVVHHKKNRGVGAAQSTGCDHGTKKYVSYMDSDGQFRAQEFDLLLPMLTEHRMAAGYRIKRADPPLRSLNAWLYGRLVRVVLGVKKRDINCGLVVMERDLWPLVKPRFATGGLFPAEMYASAKRLGVEIAQVGVPHYPRSAGKQSGASPLVIFRMFKELCALKKALRKQG